MCGICGIVDFSKQVPANARRETVMSMNKDLLHRGPDSSGQYDNEIASVAMRRLAIVDVDGGDQPIFNEDRTLCIVFNGELYNYRALREELSDLAYRFYTNTDTEVILKLYEHKGERLFEDMNGMYSFCIYDLQKQCFLFGRDPFGEKPFFYHHRNNVFSFSSEIRSLLQNGHIDRILDQNELPHYLRSSTIPEPNTLIKDVKSLPPGHLIKLDKRGIQVKRYFNTYDTIEPFLKTEDEAVEYLEPYLHSAVKRQSESSVPLGAFLSGGIDSSSIVAILQEQNPRQVSTFNVKFEDQAYDESSIAREVARHCGTDHHQLVLPNFEFNKTLFWEIIDRVGLPFRDTSAIPTYLISKEISKHVKVALSGDGGDELFGGYDMFQWYLKINQIRKIPKAARSLAHASIKGVSSVPLFSQSNHLRKANRALQSSNLPIHELPVSLSEMFSKIEIKELLKKGLLSNGSTYKNLEDIDKLGGHYSPLRRIMSYRLRHVLPVNMLVKVDRMSMANSLEVRAPFLDLELYRATLRIPDHLLLKKGSGKYLLRKIMANKLPASVFSHRKQGFNLPLHMMYNSAYKDLARDLLFSKNGLSDLFDKGSLKEVYEAGLQTKSSNAFTSVFQTSHKLWMMMQLFGWARRFNIEI